MDGNRVGYPWHTRANDQLLLHQLTRTFRIPPEHRRDFFCLHTQHHDPSSNPSALPHSLPYKPLHFPCSYYPTFGDYSSILDASSRTTDNIPIRLRCSEFRIPPLESFLTLPQPDTPFLAQSIHFSDVRAASGVLTAPPPSAPLHLSGVSLLFSFFSFALPKPLPHPDSLPASHPCSAFRL